MKHNKFFMIGLLIISFSTFAKNKEMTISGFIPVEMDGDIGQYVDTVSKSRDETRAAYMKEVVDAAMELSQGQFDPTDMIKPLMELQEKADTKRDEHVAIDSANIGLAVSAFFSAQLEQFNADNGISNLERKFELVNVFNIQNDQQI